MGFDWTAYIQTAKAEIRERLQALNDGLLRLEGDAADPSVVDEVFRHAHSIKGSAQMVGLDMVSRVAHGLEDALGVVRSGKLQVSPVLLDVAFQTLDTIERILEDPPASDALGLAEDLAAHLSAIGSGGPVTPFAPAAEAGEGEAEKAEPLAAVTPQAPAADSAAEAVSPGDGPAPEGGAPIAVAAMLAPSTGAPPAKRAAGPAPAPSAPETVRVPGERIDRILTLAGELATMEQQERALLEGIRGLNGALRRLRSGRGGEAGAVGAEWDRSLDEACGRANAMVRSARGLVTARTILGREIRDAAMDLRLLPVSTLFERFPRPVRDLARAAGKEVQLSVEGEETRLDKKILDELYDPILHLLRNAVDHGVEAPAERAAAGKPATGTILLRAVPHGRVVWLQVCDDGHGISIDRVRQAACDRGLVTPAEAAALSQEQTLQLLFRPGFSTAEKVTAVSGRGVGLDVVYSNVHGLKGMVRLENHPGEGTAFTLEIPLTLATTRVLLLECGAEVYALPGALVRGVVELAAKQTQGACGQRTTTWKGRTVPLWYLEALLGTSSGQAPERRPVVMVTNSGRTVGVVVDRLLDEEEVVLKPTGALLQRAPLVSAGTVLGDGRVALLLDVDALAAVAKRPRAAEASARPAGPRKYTILLADDALTTREVERAILEAAGYEVTTAMDGQEAWEKLAARTFDLVVTDVEMPRMNGLELTRQITSDARTSAIPVVIITSLAREEDRRRGLEAGAAAYIVKSAFDQENLLDLIGRLIR